MTRAPISSLAGALAITAGTALMLIGLIPLQTGCETQSADDNSLRVEPHSIGLRINQSAEFTATGGFTYKWSLSDPSLGVLTRSEGQTTTYISRFNPEAGAAAVIQRLIVTSTVGGSGSVTDDTTGTTNTTTTGFIDTDEAIIEHLPTGDEGTTPGTTTTTTTSTTTAEPLALSVSPAVDSLSSGQSQTFTASGEGPDYSWSLSNGSLGSLNQNTGRSVTYTANTLTLMTPTDVILTVTSNGESASARITRL